MIIDKSTVGISKLYTQRVQANETARGASSAGKAKGEHDQIEISEEAQALTKATQAAGSAEEVRWEKVNALRQQVASGEYKVPVEELAQRLLADV